MGQVTNRPTNGCVEGHYNQVEELGGKFHSLVEDSPVGAYILQDGKFVYVNPRVADILGYSREEFCETLELMDTVAPEDREKVRVLTQNRWSSEQKSAQYTFKALRKDGSTVEVEVIGSITTYKGRPAVIGSMMDVTARHESEEILARRTRQLEILRRTSLQLNAVLDIPIVMRTLVSSALELADAESGTCGLVMDGQMIFVEYNRKGDVIPIDYKFDPGCGVPGWVLQHRKPYMTNDAEHDPQVVCEVQQTLGFYNLADVPIISRHGELLGCFEIHNTVGHRPFDENDISMLEGLAAAASVALENAKMIEDRRRDAEERLIFERQMEAHKRKFYRETILSVTDGKLDVCDMDEILPIIEHPRMSMPVTDAREASDVRRATEDLLMDLGLDGERLNLFIMGVGEATANVIKHASDGYLSAGVDDGRVWVAVCDRGQGMESLILPKAVLLRGFSTKSSLGLGYSVILDVSDSVMLSTGEEGTTVVMFKNVEEPAISLEALRYVDTW